MNSSAAEIDLKLREDFRRYLREYGVEAPVADPVLGVFFKTLASQIHNISSETDRLRGALLDELIEGLGFERRLARPAQTVVQYRNDRPAVNVAVGTELMGELSGGGRMTFTTDYDLAVSPARVAFVLLYQGGSLRLVGGMELPAETLQAGPSYTPVPIDLGPHPAVLIALENLRDTYLSRHGFFFQINPEATLLSAQLGEENWCLGDNQGRFGEPGILRPYSSNAGHLEMQWLNGLENRNAAPEGPEVARLPGGFWSGRCFVLPSIPKEKHFACQVPRGLETPLRSIFERSAILLSRSRAWIRIQLPQRIEPLHSAITAIHVNAGTASNVECLNQTIRFADDGSTIPISREAGARACLVSPLSVTGESGRTYLPEFHPSFEPGVGRFRLHQGHLTLIPGTMADGRLDSYVNVRVWTTLGAAGNQLGATALRSFAKAAPEAHLQVTNITAAAGGTDGEEGGSAQLRFAESLLSRQRLLTRKDFETAVRAFDRRITGVDVQPQLTRTARGVSRLHRVVVTARRDAFVAPEEEARVLTGDLQTHLSERTALDLRISVELAWA
ncbi:MAG TPA: hypothetical protein VKZ53_15785 [Candidatus Angelobacter sp.]|nr:hypothetical protein [Candidatus Angelobacter sp.]